MEINARWAQNGSTVAGGNGKGNGLNQLPYSWSLYVDDNQTVYITDSANHCITEWKTGATSGKVVAGGNGGGNQTNQLNDPRSVAVDRKNDCRIICDQNNRRVVRWPRQNGTKGEIVIINVECSRLTIDNDRYLYVSDYINHEVKRWRMGDTRGTVVAGGNGCGDRLDQLSCPTFLFVDHKSSLYVSDISNHRVMKWMKGAEEGIIDAGGQGQGNSLAHLSKPSGVIVDRFGTVYVSDYDNHRVMCWPKGAAQGSIVVGGNDKGEQPNQLNNPTGLAFDRQGNLYVLDKSNYRVQKFNIDSSSNQ